MKCKGKYQVQENYTLKKLTPPNNHEVISGWHQSKLASPTLGAIFEIFKRTIKRIRTYESKTQDLFDDLI